MYVYIVSESSNYEELDILGCYKNLNDAKNSIPGNWKSYSDFQIGTPDAVHLVSFSPDGWVRTMIDGILVQ